MNWTTVKLEDLAEVALGGGAPQEADAFSAEGTPFVRAGSLVKLLEGLPEESLELLQDDVAARHKLKLFPAGTVMFAKSGMSATKGHVYQLKNPAYVVNHLAALTPRSKIAGDYLKQVLRFKSPTCLIKDEAYPSIRLGDIKEMEIPAPKDEGERARIAAILNQADELRRKRQRTIDRLNKLGKAIFHEMFGGSGADNHSISELIDEGSIELHKDGNHGSKYPRKEEFGDDGVPFLSANAVDDFGRLIPSQVQKLDENKAKTLTIGWIRAGDVLLSHNASVGKVALYEGQFGDALIGTSLTCYRVNPTAFTPHFMFYALRSLDFQNQLASNMAQTTRNQVPITAQRRLTLPKPSLTAQKVFEEKMRVISSQVDSIANAQEALEALFASLQFRAFTGEI